MTYPIPEESGSQRTRSALYVVDEVPSVSKNQPLQLRADQTGAWRVRSRLVADGSLTVPLLNASAVGLDLNKPFSELSNLPSMYAEAPRGSLGVVFYTVCEYAGFKGTLDFNLHGFVMLAAAPAKASSARA